MKVVDERSARNEKSISGLWDAHDQVQQYLSRLSWRIFIMISVPTGLLVYQLISQSN